MGLLQAWISKIGDSTLQTWNAKLIEVGAESTKIPNNECFKNC